MTHLLQLLIAHIVGNLLGSLYTKVRPLRLLINAFQTNKTIEKFIRQELSGYDLYIRKNRHKPKQATGRLFSTFRKRLETWVSEYYTYSFPRTKPGSLLERASLPTFHFFVTDDVVISRFEGFLIPALDSGHRGMASTVGDTDQEGFTPDGKLRHTLSTDWKEYLEGIGNKARIAFEAASAGPNSPSRFGPMWPWKRLIFFDQQSIRHFIARSKELAAEIQGGEGPVREFTRNIVRYAANIAAIHSEIAPHARAEHIQTRYLDRAEVSATHYYDFGYYLIGEVPVVFHPIYWKSSPKAIAEARVFVGSIGRHRDGIENYLANFNYVWNSTSEPLVAQDVTLKNHGIGDPIYEGREYCPESGALSFEYFHRGYYAALKHGLEEHFGMTGLSAV